jgi:hypothetical protein
VGFLHHVGRVHAAPQLRVKAQADKLAQVRPVADQEPVEGLDVAVANLL